MKIFVAAGHGNKDSGSLALNTTERDELIKIVDKAVENLMLFIKPPHQLIKVPSDLALLETVKYINERTGVNDNAICVEYHLNSNQGTPGTGTETYYGFQKLAAVLHRSAIDVLKLTDRGVKTGNHIYFNNMTVPPSALVELGFINNPVDLQAVREKGALAIEAGIKAYMAANQTATPMPQPPSEDYKKMYEEMEQENNRLYEILQKIEQYVNSV